MNKFLLKFIELWLATIRGNALYSNGAERAILSGRPFIIALWHRDLIYGLYHFRRYPGVMMVSGSKDGEWVARALRLWGQHPVRGSRHKGGMKAIKEMAQYMMENGLSAGIVADGSQGPAERVQIGALVLSRLTGAPILPLGVAISRVKRLNTWDRLVIPLPFSRAVVALGRPLNVPEDVKGNALEGIRHRLEEALRKAHGIAMESLCSS